MCAHRGACCIESQCRERETFLLNHQNINGFSCMLFCIYTAAMATLTAGRTTRCRTRSRYGSELQGGQIPPAALEETVRRFAVGDGTVCGRVVFVIVDWALLPSPSFAGQTSRRSTMRCTRRRTPAACHFDRLWSGRSYVAGAGGDDPEWPVLVAEGALGRRRRRRGRRGGRRCARRDVGLEAVVLPSQRRRM